MSYCPTHGQREAEAWCPTQLATSDTHLKHAMRVLVFFTGAKLPDSLARYGLKGGYPHPGLVAVVRTCLSEIDKLIGGPEQRWLRPERHGLPWSQREDAALTQAFDEGCELSILAQQLERSEGSVLFRLEQMGRIKAPDEDAFLVAQIDALLLRAERPDSASKIGRAEAEGDQKLSAAQEACDSSKPGAGRMAAKIHAHPASTAPTRAAVAVECRKRAGCFDEKDMILRETEVHGHKSKNPAVHRPQAIPWARGPVAPAYPWRGGRDSGRPGAVSDLNRAAGVAR
jgi:hypothetical protein